jgi:pantoate--beta-alanine ligase
MLLFYTIEAITKYLKIQNPNTSIGFVPTMGALHLGHISLVEKAFSENNLVVASIFVNPTQFNNVDDLNNYPKSLESDIQKLENAGCHALFLPTTKEMYEVNQDELVIDYGQLENVMEGKSRPGHFKGVSTIVFKLFKVIQPNIAYFGEKDFQQLAIIKALIEDTRLPIKIIGCKIIREKDGLAMSSRNARLTAEERKVAPKIYQALLKAADLSKTQTIPYIKDAVIRQIESTPGMKLDYFEFVNAQTLQPISTWDKTNNTNVRACIAVTIGNIRLIDNIAIIL